MINDVYKICDKNSFCTIDFLITGGWGNDKNQILHKTGENSGTISQLVCVQMSVFIKIVHKGRS